VLQSRLDHSELVKKPAKVQELNSQFKTILGDYPLDTFLKKSWQKRALFLPGALAGFHSPVDGPALLKLACHEEAEARLIDHARAPRPGESFAPWRLTEGPFEEHILQELGEFDWTLLVQDVDKFLPSVARLLKLINFLPSWSIDDIMISFAKPGASVGPHTDRYDVFLLQAQGTRRWQLSSQVNEENLRSDTELKVLAEFESEESYLAQPGDVLYIPPGVAHFGVAEEDCLTLSFGFRSPPEATLLSALSDEVVAEAGEKQLNESRLQEASTPAELSPALLRKVQTMMEEGVKKIIENPHWLGRYLTEAKPNIILDLPNVALSPDDLELRLFSGEKLVRASGARFLYVSPTLGEAPNCAIVFVDGIDYSLKDFSKGKELARIVCEEEISTSTLSPWLSGLERNDLIQLLTEFYSNGYLRLH